MEDSNNVHHPRVAVLCWDLSFTPIQVYQLPTYGTRVPRLARVAYIAQLSRPVAVRRLKTERVQSPLRFYKSSLLAWRAACDHPQLSLQPRGVRSTRSD